MLGGGYLGQVAFAEQRRVTADVTLAPPPCNAVADAAAPELQASSAFAVPTASAAASAPVPVVSDGSAPAATAIASFPAPRTTGGLTRRDDLPTTLTFSYVTEMVLALVREVELYERTTALEMGRATEVDLFQHVSEVALQQRTTTLAFTYSTTLEISMETTLALHDRELELVLDG